MLAGANVATLASSAGFLSHVNVLVKGATKSYRSVRGLFLLQKKGATPPKEPLALIRSL